MAPRAAMVIVGMLVSVTPPRWQYGWWLPGPRGGGWRWIGSWGPGGRWVRHGPNWVYRCAHLDADASPVGAGQRAGDPIPQKAPMKAYRGPPMTLSNAATDRRAMTAAAMTDQQTTTNCATPRVFSRDDHLMDSDTCLLRIAVLDLLLSRDSR